MNPFEVSKDAPAPPNDGLDDAGASAPHPVPPHYDAQLSSATADIQSAALDVGAAIADTLATLEREAASAQQSVYDELNALIGQIDLETTAAGDKVFGAYGRAIKAIEKETSAAVQDLRVNEIAAPFDMGAIIMDLQEEVPNRVFQRLSGVYPEFAGNTAPAEVTQPLPEEVLNVRSDTEPAGDSAPILSVVGEGTPAPPANGDALPVPPADSHACACEAPVVNAPAPIVNVTCGEPAREPIAKPGETIGGGGGTGGGAAPSDGTLEVPPAATGAGTPVAPAPAPPAAPAEPEQPVEYWTGVVPMWNHLGVCGSVNTAIRELRNSQLAFDAAATNMGAGGFLSGAWRATQAMADGVIEYAFGGFDSKRAESAFHAAYLRAGDTLSATTQARDFLKWIPGALVPDMATTWTLGTMVGIAAKAEADSGVPLTRVVLPMTYLFNSMHAHEIPSAGELDQMRRAGYIDKGRWECLQRAHGIDPTLRDIYFSATDPAFSGHEIEALRMRGAVNDEQARVWYDHAGMHHTSYERLYKALSVFYPGPSDIIRFTARDAFDPAVIESAQLGFQFEEKLGAALPPDQRDKVQALLKATGITEDILRLFYYAHWDQPSNTALYEMQARYRVDRPEVLAFQLAHNKWIPGEPTADGIKAPLVVTKEMARALMQVNDMAPGWIEKLLGIAELPVTRTDAIGAYHAGTFTEEDLYHAVRDQRYSDKAAKQLVELERAKRGRRLANIAGGWTIREILRSYADGEINGMRADALLEPLVLDPAQRQRLLTDADTRVDAKVIGATLKRLRRGFIVGTYDEKELAQTMNRIGVSDQRQADLVSLWDEERRGRFKEPTARMIQSWVKDQIIVIDDALSRLQRIGYERQDAERIVYQGMSQAQAIAEKDYKAREKAISVMYKDLRQARRADERALRERLEELEKAHEAQEKERERLEKELERRRPK